MLGKWDVATVKYLNAFVGRWRMIDHLVLFSAKYLQYPLVAMFFGFAYFFFASGLERTAVVVFTALSVSIARFALTPLIRVFYKRPRPYDSYQLQPLVREREWSFPSGHAVFFFALAASVFSFDPPAGIIFFAAAFVMALARVIAGAHYLTDILAGALTGVLVTYVIVTVVAIL